MKKVTILNGVVDAVYLCEPPEGVETIDAPDEVFSGWLYDRTTFTAPAPFDPVVTVPSVVSAFQAKAALMGAGLYDKSASAAQAAGGLTWLAWQTATEFQRASPAIATLASALALTDAQVDELFITAAKIIA